MFRRMIFLVSFVFVLALVLTNFAQADLIGYWKFDESSGIIAADSAGGDNDGILFGDGLEWTAGMFGGALSHGGVWDAGVEILTTGMSARAGTVAMWGVLSDPQPAHTKYFFGHTTQRQWTNRVQLYMDEGDNLLDIGLGNSHTLDTDILELPMEQWLHVALTWDSGRYVVYVDGEEVSSGAYGGLSDIYPVANIGNDGCSGPYEGFAGLLDEVRLYDHALNAAEILAAMEGVEKVDVTALGDAIQGVPNDGLHDGSRNFGWWKWHSPDLAIDDDVTTKYLHFKGETETTGFQVTPSAGATIVTGLTLTTANDFPARDPIAFELSGSNVGIDGPYELIASSYIVDFAQAEAWPRLTKNATPISFYNDAAYEHYQVLFPAVREAGNANSMQIAEVELLEVSAPSGADIILVTEAIDYDWDGLRDDHSLESFLISEGHSVDVRPEYWNELTPDKIAELNAADLIIVSRLGWSSRYNQGNEETEWNSLKTPLLTMNSHFTRNSRWNWINSDARAPDDTSYIYAGAVDSYHPIFRGVPMTLYDPTLRGGPLNATQVIDPLVGTGYTAFIGGTDMGNGRLIAKPVGLEMGWIAEWDAGVEFYEGAGQYAGGRRMLFCAGTFFDPDREEVIIGAQGELNLTAEGLQMFRNAIDYLLKREFTPDFTESVVEDFETETFGQFPWSSYGDESWETTRSERHSGYYSAKSGSIEDGEESTLEVSIDCVSGHITFYCKVSSESGYDKLTFYIDGLEQGTWSGQEDWAEVSFHVREGTRTFKWAYSKDSSISEGDDTAWIDDIVFPVNSSLALERSSAVSTFHCIGVYWSPQDGSSDNVCQVLYRSEGSTGWKEALPLWYDDRGAGGNDDSDFPYPPQYRGSIVNLEPGTTYEIELRLLNTGTIETFTASTWSEDFPIAKTVYLPAGTTNQALSITESGSPDGYILYTYPEGESSTINVKNQEDSCIYVSGSYIIIRGLTLREASVHGIRILHDVHDVVIEECDISGWGRLQEGEWGHDLDSAVYSNSPNIERIIVQRNKLHHPRADTNSRKEPARTIPINSIASKGPCAIVFTPRDERAGHYVIRYNEIYSDDDHYFKDAMGDWFNNSYHGFPVRDTDIYGNYIERCWSHGIQSEGANCNVRIWGNYITRTPHKIATRSVTVGPIYVWRNVLDISRVGPAPEHNYGWGAFKAGNFGSWSHGKYYMFHNTILQPPPPDAGSSSGITSGSGNTLGNMFTRNNILHISDDGDNSIFNENPNSTNDFDYDLFNGYIDTRGGSERNGIYGVPIYDRNNGDGEFALDPSSPGYDAGEVIPNFNDNYNGAAPDIGAHEAGSPPMEFGVNAYE